MDWENKTIGFAMCGSFCTFKKAMGVLESSRKPVRMLYLL